jgi:hypothetical protein
MYYTGKFYTTYNIEQKCVKKTILFLLSLELITPLRFQLQQAKLLSAAQRVFKKRGYREVAMIVLCYLTLEGGGEPKSSPKRKHGSTRVLDMPSLLA